MSWNTHIPKFRRFVLQNFPFIEEDFDALTDYALICKVVEYLNKVIDSQNGLVSEVELLEGLFNELKNYVDTYFDNLDVQEEINNKLDEMADDGTLQEIVADYLNSKAVFGFDNVASMKTASNLIDGSYAHTLGYHTKNDGGASLYKIRKITNDDTIDEKFIIEMNDGADDLVAELIVVGTIQPEMVGAYGDGTHDDSDAIQACLSSTYPISLTKSYLINSTLNVGGHNEYVIKGEGSTITYTGSGSALLIKNINGGQIDLGRVRAENGTCIEFSSTLGTADRIIYTDLTFKHLSAGDKCISINTSGTGYVSENTIRGGELLHGNYGVYIYANPSAHEYGVNAIHFTNMGFEGPDVNYYIEATSTRYIRGLTFTNDRFVENTTSKIFEIHGNVQRCTMNSWSHIDESRLDFTNATLRRFKLVCPVYKPNTTTIYADGIYYDGSDKRYLFNEYSANLLTKNEGVTGSIRMIRYENLCILLCSDITVTSNGIDLVNAGDNPYIPAYTAQGCLTSGNGNSARVFVRATDGSIHFATSSASAGDTFYGTIIYPYEGNNT